MAVPVGWFNRHSIAISVEALSSVAIHPNMTNRSVKILIRDEVAIICEFIDEIVVIVDVVVELCVKAAIMKFSPHGVWSACQSMNQYVVVLSHEAKFVTNL